MNRQIEQKLDSREVAEMIEMGHPELLRKIDSINKDFRECKIAFSKYWEESSYKVDGNNRAYKNFLITKRGCEFLAHKTTGSKGNLFTDRYMDRFEQMKDYISTGKVKSVKVDKSLKEKEIEARYNNSLVRKANLLLKLAKDNPLITDEYRKVLESKAAEMVTGELILPLPVAERGTFNG